LLKMAREGLLHGLRTALQEARRARTPIRRDRLRVRSNGGWHEVTLQVLPLGGTDRPYCLVLFEENTPPARPAARSKREVRAAVTREKRDGDERAKRLEQELASSREYLPAI